jgi:hypothetical protein
MAINTGNLYVSQSLSGIASGRALNQYIADRVFPVVPVQLQTGFIYNIDPKNQYNRELNTERAPGVEPNTIYAEDPTRTSYFAAGKALQGRVTDEQKAQVDAEARAALPEIDRLLNLIYLKREIDLVTKVSALSQTSSPSTKWDASGGDFVKDTVAQFDTIETATGRRPNAIAMSGIVARKVVQSTTFRNQFQYNYNANNTPLLNRFGSNDFAPAIAAALDIPVENVMISNAYRNSAAIGATASNASVWGENVVLFVAGNPREGDYTQVLGVHPVWTGLSGQPVTIEVARDEFAKCDKLAAYHYYDQLLLNPLGGYLFTNVLA